MHVTLLKVPYHLGRGGAGMARGPGRYLAAGLAAALAERGVQTKITEVRRPGAFTTELAAIAAINVALARGVRAATAAGSLPLVAGGDCNVALGMVGGLGAADTAIVWFDAHGDFNTPETTASGYIDGMPLAMACGRAHPQVWTALGGDPVPEAHVLHVGSRDLDPDEATAFASWAGYHVSCEKLLYEGGERALTGPLAALASATRRAYLHVDCDVLDPVHAPGVDFPSPGGLTPDQLLAAVGTVAGRLAIAGISFTAYDPARDDAAGTTLALGLALLPELVARAWGQW